MILIQPITFIQFGPDVLNTIGPAPLSITPLSMMQGQSVNATVTGTHFTNTTTFSLGAGITISSLVIVNATTATMVLTSTSTTPLGTHDLTATDNTISTTLVGAFLVLALGAGDFFDYIFQFPDQGSFLRDPLIQKYAPSVLGSQPGVQLLIYNPVETLNPPIPTAGNALVIAPQLAQSTVALPGFWAMLTIQSSSFIPDLANHSNLQILNDRTLMFAGTASVVQTRIDVSHINIVINIYGVYVTDGLKVLPRNFFISSVGNDNNVGISTVTPWRTIGRVNVQTMLPGDTYSFRGGDTFSDATLMPTASGSTANPITFQSYGAGKATFSRVGADTISFTKLSYITINNLICTGSGGTVSGQCGIRCVYSSGSNSNLTISNVDVSGFSGNGIYVDGALGGFLANITISGCTANGNTLLQNIWPDADQQTAGIYVEGKYGAYATGIYTFTNITVSNCVAHGNTGAGGMPSNGTGSGIFVGAANGALITGCVTYNNGANHNNPNFGPVGIEVGDINNLIVQYCESYNNHTVSNGADGDGFDFSGGTFNSIMEYCYSHGNDGHGFSIDTYDDPGPVGVNCVNNTLRFCISEGDCQNVRTDQGGIQVANAGSVCTNTGLKIYGNTVYGSSGSTFCGCFHFSSGGTALSGTIANNIFYSGANNIWLISNPSFSGTTLKWYGNDYFAVGTWNIDYNGTEYASLVAWQVTGQEVLSSVPVGTQANPTLTSPGAGGTANAGSFVTPAQLAAITAYKLAHGSAMFHAGLNLTTQFSINPGSLDFYSNAITASTLSIGANCPTTAP